MKVVHLINDLEVGGAQRVVEDLTTGATACQASVLTLHPVPASKVQLFRERNVEIRSLRPLRSSRSREAKRLISEADLLHVHLFPSFYLAAALNKPKIFTEHSMHNRRRDRGWARSLERRIYGRYNRIVCISGAARSSLETWLKHSPQTIQVIENGISLDRYLGKIRALPERGLRVVMAGTFTRRKDHSTLVRAMAQLPVSVSLTLLGEGPQLPAVRALAGELGVERRVEFRGVVAPEAMPEVLGGFDLYVQSSHFESFGLAALEAMACGIPALGSDLPGLAEVIGDTSLLFPSGDAEALAQLIGSIHENAARYEECSQAALARSQRFDVAQTVSAYESLYSEVLGGC